MSERIQKVLAAAGIGSRREIESWIKSGRIVVSGKRAKLGDRLSGKEAVLLDGKKLDYASENATAKPRCIVYYKPAGEVTSRDDPEGRKLVFDSLPRLRSGRWISVGRLDISTLGLLLFTTDGELAHRLMHPSYEIARRYSVRVLGELSSSQFSALQAGVELDDGLCKFDSIQPSGGTGSNVWYEVSLKEGRNRAVRRMFESVGATVSRLIRTAYGPIEVGRMRRGETRPLSPNELTALYRAVKLRAPLKSDDSRR